MDEDTILGRATWRDVLIVLIVSVALAAALIFSPDTGCSVKINSPGTTTTTEPG